MIVVDASALLESLLHTSVAAAIDERLFALGEIVHAPHLIDVEIAQVLRRYAASGLADADRCRGAIVNLVEFPLERHAHGDLLPRIWDLRANISAYDAAYVALAHALDAPLLTRDRRLAAAARRLVQVDLV